MKEPESHGATATAPRVVAIVQARLGSTRLPGKVLQTVEGWRLLDVLVSRLRQAELVSEIVLAIPDSEENKPLVEAAGALGLTCNRGSESDVLGRYVTAVTASKADVVVRITGDCPFVSPELVDRCVSAFLDDKATYLRTSEQFPDGLDVEVVQADTLIELASRTDDPRFREHVTLGLAEDPTVPQGRIEPEEELPPFRITVDDPEDLQVVANVIRHFGGIDFTLSQLGSLMLEAPGLFSANLHLRPNEGLSMSTGEKLWRRAQRVIPGGNMLLSKRAEQFLPTGWPTYFSRASGCRVWDLDDREFVDLGYMGVGTNILGYGHPRVDEAVRRVISSGNLSTLNCPEEVELAERLCELHPWADMAKFTRSGGEADAVAIRIARAASGRDAVAICGYHGWHDWYLSANLGDEEALDGHLLPGLDPRGVPRSLSGLTRPFRYNDLQALERILAADDVGAIVMEVERTTPPAPGFLEGVRQLATERSVPLIFDECTSGFRKVLGGLHLHYGVAPDLAVFGKTLGNGYAINAVIGRREVMEYASSTFISSTFWTERIGPTAALASLKAMEDESAPLIIDGIGNKVRRIWDQAAARHGFDLSVTGLPALSNFVVEGVDPVAARQLIIRSFLEHNILGGPFFYASIAHGDSVLDLYNSALDNTMARAAADYEAIASRLTPSEGRIGFGRLA